MSFSIVRKGSTENCIDQMDICAATNKVRKDTQYAIESNDGEYILEFNLKFIFAF